MKAQIGISPICWWNDDLVELSDDVSLEECFRQTKLAGYTGLETGRRFPKDPKVLGPILKANHLKICGGWHSGLLLTGDLEAEKDRIRAQLDLFKAAGGSPLVYGETDGSVQGDRSRPLSTKPTISEDEFKVYGRKITALAEWMADQGMPLTYHHHMGTACETEHEVDLLMKHSGAALGLLFDAGHMAFAGGDCLRVIDKHHKRITHVHTKDVRLGVIAKLDRTRQSFLDAVVLGAFTVPGDGSLDWPAIIGRLAHHGYEGWFVVEAEQDPKKAPPLAMAELGHRTLVSVLTKAGYAIEK